MFSNDYSDILIRALYDASTLYPTAKKKPNINQGLCNCKQRILSSYFKNIIGLLIEVNAVTYETAYEINEKHIIERFEHIKSLFNFFYISLYSETCLSSKIVLLFEKLQQPIDEQMFSKVRDYLFMLAESTDEEEKRKTYRDLHENILNWSELAIFNISGLYINCSSITDNILDGKDVVNPTYCCTTNPCKRQNDCKNCELHKKIENNNEILKLYIIDELSLIPNWYEFYFELFKKYHKNPKNIVLDLDYQLCQDPTLCLQNACPYKLKFMGSFFGDVTISNYLFTEECPIDCEFKTLCVQVF